MTKAKKKTEPKEYTLDSGRTVRTKREDLSLEDMERIPRIIPHYNFDSPDVPYDVQEDMVENIPVGLTGHAGVGKTSLYEQIAARGGQPVLRVNLNGQTTISDFVGCWGIKNGETFYNYGALPTSMHKGLFLILDEIDRAEPAILSVLNAVLERYVVDDIDEDTGKPVERVSRGNLYLKEKGDELIRPHKYFRILATGNTLGVMQQYRYLYPGTNIMDSALIDRFRIYEVFHLEAAQEIEVLIKGSALNDEKLARKLVEFASSVRDNFSRGEMKSTISLRGLLDLGDMIMRKVRLSVVDPNFSEGAVILTAIKACIFSKVSREDQKTMNEIIRTIDLGNMKVATP